MKKIIDVSQWQGKIDWEAVRGNVDGVIIRAGYGQNNIDPWADYNFSECNRLGIPCGAYWFSYALTPDMARKEAAYMLAFISKYRIELPVAYDWEYDSRDYMLKKGAVLTKDVVSEMARQFLNACEAAGHWAMLYTNPDMGGKYFLPSIFLRYDLWLAEWPYTWTEASKPSRSCGIWQYGGTSVPGIVGNVDSNVSYKDYYAMLRKTVEYPDEEGTTIEPVAPVEAEAEEAVDDPVAWAVKHNFVSGETETDQTIAKALYRFYLSYIEDDDKALSGLLEDE